MINPVQRILIIDDDKDILFLLEKMLSGKGYETITAENGIQGIKIIENESVDMILTDINMAEMDGLEFIEKIKIIKPQLPVIIMTSDPNVPKVKKALQHGALDFLEKPFDLDHIFKNISRYTSQRMVGRVVSLKECSQLLVTENSKKQIQIERALLSTHGSLTKATSCEQALSLLKEKPFHLLVYDVGENIPQTVFFEQVWEQFPKIKTVCVLESYDAEQLTRLVASAPIDNIVFKNKSFSEDEFIVALRKLFSRDIFGMEKYLSWGYEPIQHLVHHTDDRFKIIEKMVQYLARIKISRRFISRLEMVADEFLSNALFNAPVDNMNKPLYRNVERTHRRECTEREKPVFSYSYDGSYFGMAIQDNYGSITREQIFQGIKRCLEEKGNPSQKAGGAGLGLYMSFLTLNKFIINIKPGMKTEMIGLCNVRSSLKDFDLTDKSLSIFVEAE